MQINKFKVLDKSTGNIYFVGSLSKEEYTDYIITFFPNGWELVRVTPEFNEVICSKIKGGRDDGELFQWTRHKDKNGVDIYDKDKVKHCYNETPFDDSTRICKVETVKWSDEYLSWYRGIVPLWGYIGDLEVMSHNDSKTT